MPALAESETTDTEHHPAARRCQYCGRRQQLYTVASPLGNKSWICAACWRPMAIAGKQARPSRETDFNLELARARVPLPA